MGLVTSVALQSIVQAESIVSPDGREECNGVILLLVVFDVFQVTESTVTASIYGIERMYTVGVH
jgi:hypothetical protein